MQRLSLILLLTFTILPFSILNCIASPAPVPQTGQTTSYRTGDDGALKAGVAWPAPRFTDNTDGTVTDNLTGLVWLKDANCIGGQSWANALSSANSLASGSAACALSDGSKAGDWHLPTENELFSLVDLSQYNPALPVGHPFTNIQAGSYWSSSGYSEGAWFVAMNYGYMDRSVGTGIYFVWPVRGGQSTAPTTYTLSLTKSGTGTGTVTPTTGTITWTGNSGSVSYNNGTSITLSATPNTGSTFSGWSGACSGTGSCQVTMDAVKSVTATFALAIINGTCGSSNTGVFTIAPSTNLCTTGTASSVTGSGPWSWDCSGTNGGTTASCGAYLQGKAAIQLPITGQTICYDAAGAVITCTGTGQDGELQVGAAWPAPRFTDNGDQTVTDNLTGLIWSKDANPAAGGKTWQQALDYIKTLNSQNYQGHNDWRLPNINELKSLVNQGQSSPATWLNSQGFINVQADFYWSGSTYANYTNSAWVVYMYGGYVGDYGKTGYSYVWPVRSGQSGYFGSLTLSKTGQTTCYDTTGTVISCSGTGQDGELQVVGEAWPSPRFTANADQTVTDNLTGLIWSKDGNTAAGYKTWQQALDYIKGLNSSNYLGHNDWRLPNRNELESMVNRGQANSATWLNGQGFSNVQADFYWSGSTSAYYTSYAWFVGMSNGVVNNVYGKANYSYVWPVRSGQSTAPTTYTLSLTKSGTGTGTVTPNTGSITWTGSSGSASYNSGTSGTLTATPTSGSSFTGWSGACTNSTGTCTVTMDAAKSVTATFALSTTTGACGSANSTTVTIAPTTASALCTTGTASGVTGTGPWNWSCAGLNGGTTATCSANIQTFTIPVIVTGGNGTVSCSSPVNFNASSTCTITPTNGYSLATLTDNGVDIKTSVSANSLIITNVTSTHNIAATFTPGIANGSCGSSNSGTFTVVPSTNLCTTGTTTAITGSGPWYWTCAGSNGGTTASCSANIQTFTIPVNFTGGNGTVSCTSPVNYNASSTCTITPATGYSLATLTDNGVDIKSSVSANSFTITNVTATHNIAATFNAALANGACGSANSTTVTIVPSTSLCTTGTATTITGTGPWYWSCTGSGGGTTASCSATKQTQSWTVTSSVTSGNGAVSCTSPVNSGGSSFCTVIPATGYQLATFNDNGVDTKSSVISNSYNITNITANHTITATFTIGDTTTPTVVITSPLTTSQVDRLLEISGTATDIAGITKVEVQITDGTYYIQANNSLARTATWLTATGTSSWSLNTSLVPWQNNSTYTITARATDNANNISPLATATFTKVLVLEPDYTTLTLDLSAQTILQNGTLTATGKLTRLPDNGVNLSGKGITLTITKPDGSIVTPSPTTTYNTTGHFSFTGLNNFNLKGNYSIRATFAGSATLAQSSSAPLTLMVGTSAGYAIIVQGKIPNDPDGLASHNKTTNRIYKTMIARGFDDNNIYYLNYNTNQASAGVTVDAQPSKTAIGTAITSWAAGRMVGSPAPLYIIMVDHGSVGNFHVGGETITPTDLNGWLATLETTLAGTAAKDEKIILINGSCYSGSFIPTLTKTGRVIIASAAATEESYKGPNEPDGIRSGEYFLESLFHQLGNGSSILSSFELATDDVLRFTRKGWGTNNIGTGDGAVQHPLINDGASGNSIYLGVGVTITNAGDPADITAVPATQIITSSSTAADIWLQTSGSFNQIDNAWAEVRSPATSLNPTGKESGQLSIDLPKVLMQTDSASGRWVPITPYSFNEAGVHEVYYYARNSSTGAISPTSRSLVYKQKTNNNPPTQVTLISPANADIQKTLVGLVWTAATDPDNNSITYSLEVSEKQDFTTIYYRQEELSITGAYIQDGVLKDLTTYYWRIKAIDQYGAYSTSSAFSFTTDNTNGLPAIITGYVRNDATGAPVTNATIKLGSATATPVLPNGAYLQMAATTGPTTLTVQATGYTEKSLAVTLTPGKALTNTVYLTAIADTSPVNGVCGSDNASTFTIAPTNNLCFTGTATTVTGSGPWNWICSGSGNGGTTATCNTNIQTWTISTGNASNGSVSCTATVNNDATSTCTVTPATGYQLATFTDNSVDKKSSVSGGSYSIANVTASHAIVATFTLTPAKTKIFLGANDSFTISSSGTTLYGNTGDNAATIAPGTTGVTLDQNIGRINLPGTPNNYKFKQTGNIINVYDTADNLIVSAPVQGDPDGTLLSFSNGTATASAKLLTGGVMKLGGATVSPGAGTTLSPVTATSSAKPPTSANAKVFLGADNSFTVNSSGTTLYGNTGKGTVTISGGSTDVTLDQNIERINLPGTPGSYKFRQTGNIINVYDATTGTLIVKAPVQGDIDGTVIGFSGGTASILLSGGVMQLGGATVSPGAASVIEPVLK